MADLTLRQTILTDHFDLLKLQREWSYYCYKSSNIYKQFDLDYVNSLHFQVEKYLTDPLLYPLWREAELINNAFYARKRRLKDRIVSMYIRGPCYFGTLTFTDLVLDSTAYDTRRTYVKRFLKSTCPDYVANCDFGELHKREHYHCVCRCDSLDLLSWDLGWFLFKPIRNSDADFNRVSTYISKLTNHALKYSTNNTKIIYSRGEFYVF